MSVVSVLGILLVLLPPPATQGGHPALEVAGRVRAGIEAGDAAALRSLFHVDDPRHQPLADAYLHLLIKSAALREASERAFSPRGPGDQPVEIGSVLPEPQLLADDGDRAEVLLDPSAPPLVLRRVGDDWRVDVRSAVGPDDAHLDDQALLLEEMARVIERTTEDIRVGRFATPTDARSILAQRMSELLGRRELLRTRPTTRPTPP